MQSVVTVPGMDTTQNILTLPLPDVSDEVAAYMRSYQPQLLTAAQNDAGLATIKHLVLACGPVSEVDWS